jgi:hypothetical protein
MDKWYDSRARLQGIDLAITTHPVQMGAEYRFVPLHPKVKPALKHPCTPKGRPSHAVPVPGGFSGRLEFDLVAGTPVLFGMAGTAGSQNATVHARLHDGMDAPFAAPGRAIRGLIHSVFTIATFSRFAPLNGDHRFSSRNMDYLDHVVGQERGEKKTGWLSLAWNKDGLTGSIWHVDSIKIPCSDLASAFNPSELLTYLTNDKRLQLDNDKNYQNLSSQEKTEKIWNTLTFSQRSIAIGRLLSIKDKYNVSFALAGHIVNGSRIKKHIVTAGRMETRRHELLFDPPDWGLVPIKVNQTALNAFLFGNTEYASGKDGALYPMGGRRKPRDKDKGNFRVLLCEWLKWLAHAECGNDEAKARGIAAKLGVTWNDVHTTASRPYGLPGIPVHTIGVPGDEKFEIGTAGLVPAQPGGAVRDFLPHDHDPLNPNAFQGLDWSDAVFGRVPANTADDAALKGRVTFDFAKVEKAEELPNNDPGATFTVLQGPPRASFDPFSLRRAKPRGEPGSAVASWHAPETAEVAGYRRYPAAAASATLSNATGSQALIRHVRVLDKDAIYRCAIDFHNLHPAELGALLWAVTFGDCKAWQGSNEPTPFRHVGGRLRNKGLGRLSPANARFAWLERNPFDGGKGQADAQSPVDDETWNSAHGASALMAAFEVEMGRHAARDDGLVPSAARSAFFGSETITALLNSSDAGWADGGQAPKRGAGGMFSMPLQGAKDYFKSFQNLRKLVYQNHRDFPPDGARAVMEEFFTPVQDAPALSKEAAELLTALTA